MVLAVVSHISVSSVIDCGISDIWICCASSHCFSFSVNSRVFFQKISKFNVPLVSRGIDSSGSVVNRALFAASFLFRNWVPFVVYENKEIMDLLVLGLLAIARTLFIRFFKALWTFDAGSWLLVIFDFFLVGFQNIVVLNIDDIDRPFLYHCVYRVLCV